MAKVAKKKAPPLHSYRYYIINVKIRLEDTIIDLPADEYTRIFKEFYQSFIVARSSKQKDCLLQTQGEKTIDQEKIYFGQIVQVTNINNKKWFNKKQRLIDPKFSVPSEYAANAVTAEYIFIPSVHRFVYQVTTRDYLDPYGVKTYFTRALKILLPSGYIIDIDVESDVSTIQRILEAPGVAKLYFRINYSNNGFSKELQEFVENDMKSSNTGELEIK